jgi:cytochrome d ubiquinol oxidase subunit II
MWLGVTFYTLFGGADLGAGFWDLMAGNSQRGIKQRNLIERSIGPVWEANHVWLIFVLVITWTCFPVLFGSVTSTLWIPFMLAALGIVARGSTFAFREAVTKIWQKRVLGIVFGISAILVPFFFGTMAGAVAAGRVPVGVGVGNELTSWWNPVSIVTGLLAVAVCAYLTAVYLTVGAHRNGNTTLITQFRRRSLATGLITGLIAIVGLVLIHYNTPLLAHGLAHRGLPFVILSGLAGITALGLLYRENFATARIVGAVAVAAILWGWVAAQYPYVLNAKLTIAQAATVPTVLRATLLCLIIGALLLVPSLTYLYVLFRRNNRQTDADKNYLH